jgi:hypothetical protein
MNDQNQPLTRAELTTFREQRPYIPGPRGAHAIPIDFSKCGLAAAYGSPGEVMLDPRLVGRRVRAA